jgi:fucose permease
MLVFSFTDRLPTWQSFLATCACVRFVQGMLNAMIQTAAVGLLMRSVPEDRIGDALGWSEAMRGVGIMLGPGIGGGLYLALGFKAPYVFASAAWAALVLLMISFPIEVTGNQVSKVGGSMATLVRLPVVGICLVLLMIALAGLSFLGPTIQPFLSDAPYGLTEVQVGLVYIVPLIAYTLLSAVAGRMTVCLGELRALPLGLLLMAAGFILMAPSHELSFPTSLVPALDLGPPLAAVIVSMVLSTQRESNPQYPNRPRQHTRWEG